MLTPKQILYENPNMVFDEVLNPKVEKAAMKILPFSTGFEIETDIPEKEQTRADVYFNTIQNIMATPSVSSSELRFRVPAGLAGLRCLHSISVGLNRFAAINYENGIHYHIDFTGYYDLLTDAGINEVKNWVLSELDTWKYAGVYNRRDMTRGRCWVRVHDAYHTLEFRIGECTFDYSLMLKRIEHCNFITTVIIDHITKKFKYPFIKRHSAIQARPVDPNKVISSRIIDLYV
jgi:hypothetical protein